MTGLAALFAALIGTGGCARSGPLPRQSLVGTPPEPDSATIALWHLDEAGGDRVSDAGPLRLDAFAGRDARTGFGRYGGARSFSRSIESFLYVPYSRSLETPRAITVEAWIFLVEVGLYEDTPIACRWTERPNEQSWLLGVVGRKAGLLSGGLSPGYHTGLVAAGGIGHLMFAIQPDEASLPVSYFSAAAIEPKRWTHVAASYDGEVVRLYIDGRLDAQYALIGRIRESPAPLLVGNYFDPRQLTDFGGIVRVGGVVDRTPYYAFQGLIDELRISREAREDFPTAYWR